MDETLNIPGSTNSTNQPGSGANPDLAGAARQRLDELFSISSDSLAGTSPAPAQPNTVPAPSTQNYQIPSALPPAVQPAPIQPAAIPKTSRPMPSPLRPIAVGVASFVLLMLLFKLPVFINQWQLSNQSPDPVPAVTASVTSNPEIHIPKINVSAPIVFEPSINEAMIQKGLERGVVHYGGTPKPGQGGNSVIVGHSSNDWWEAGDYKFVFLLLDKLVVGDTFSVNYEGKQYIYKVTESTVVAPTDLSVIMPTSKPTMTLITCTPPGTTWKRLAIRAEQISPEPAKSKGTQAAGGITILPGNSPSFWEQVKSFFSQVFGGESTT